MAPIRWSAAGGDDSRQCGGNNLAFGNEGVTPWPPATAANTVFGGSGNDSILRRHPGARRCRATRATTRSAASPRGISIDTIAGGTGNDVFAYTDGDDDGNNAAGGGPLSRSPTSTCRWTSSDRRGGQLRRQHGGRHRRGPERIGQNAIAAAFALGGSGAAVVAAQLTFGGRTYLVAEQTAGTALFADATDLLIDITGVTGSIATGNFV